jgi:hypothetical protein
MKHAKLVLIWTGHAKDQGEVISGTLEIRNADGMRTRLELHLGRLLDWWMHAIVLDDFLAVNVQNRSVVGA